nr:hypothetical protein [Candidatus Sigynarchaeota archaeon]
MIDTSTSDTPIFVPKDFKTLFTKPCAFDERMSNEWHQEWFTGTGISPAEHPLARQIAFSACGNCGSNDVLVIAAQWCVSYHSGDAYWDYEIECRLCGKYTKASFCEND